MMTLAARSASRASVYRSCNKRTLRLRTVLPRAYMDETSTHSLHSRGVQPLDSPQALMAVFEREMSEHCGDLSGREKTHCETLHSWMINKWNTVEASGDKAEFERLQEMVRELILGGNMEGMLATLAAHRHAEQHSASASTSASFTAASSSLDDAEEDCVVQLSSARRAELTQLFKSLDRRGEGLITCVAFEEAMHKLGDDLNDQDRESLGVTLELQGNVTLEQFLAAVEEVECDRAREQAAVGQTPQGSTDIPFLRAVSHHH